MHEVHFEMDDVSPELQEKFNARLFSILLKVPDTVKTLEEAAAWGVARGMGLTMQEISVDMKDLPTHLLESAMSDKPPELPDLFPLTADLIAKLQPYLNKSGFGAKELALGLIDKEKFLSVCREAAGDDEDLKKIARDMEKLFNLVGLNSSEDQTEEDNFKEEY